MQRTRKGRVESYVPRHPWSLGKTGTHPGYWRKNRPKGKKLIVSKIPTELYSVRDEQGFYRGWKRKK